jgi:hypothetical protein
MMSGQHFFDFAAEAGLTKHYGGLEATVELAELCHIGKESPGRPPATSPRGTDAG